MSPLGRSLRAAIPGLALLLALGAGCGRGTATSKQEGLLLAVDGIEIQLAEAEAFLPYLDTLDRRASRNTKLRKVLTDHLLPLALARRAHGGQRDELRRQAEAMVRVAGNGGFPELLAKGRNFGACRPPAGFLRSELPLVLAGFAFDPAHLGQVSPVLETPQGFAVIATTEFWPGGTSLEDRVDAVLVPFYTHAPAEFDAWLRAAIAALAGRPVEFDPDHRDALPEYLRQ